MVIRLPSRSRGRYWSFSGSDQNTSACTFDIGVAWPLITSLGGPSCMFFGRFEGGLYFGYEHPLKDVLSTTEMF